jgi:mono/diheme cytochrome c family protein
MIRPSILTLCAVAVFAYAKPLSAQYYQAAAQPGGLVVDSTLATKGKKVFLARSCNGCHTVGKGDLAGPDLGGLLERRTMAWVKKWLRDPTSMLMTDATAKAMLKQYDNLRMPNLKLTNDEIDALIHYIAAETQAAKPDGASGQ